MFGRVSQTFDHNCAVTVHVQELQTGKPAATRENSRTITNILESCKKDEMGDRHAVMF